MKKLVISILVIFSTSLVVAAEDSNDVMAMRGDAELTHLEFDAAMAEIPEKDHQAFLSSGERFETMALNLLLRDQLVIEAEKAGFADDPLVQARMRAAANQALSTMWLQHYTNSQPLPDLEALAREQHMLNPQQFMSDPSWDVSHILISSQIHSPEEAREIAAGVLEEVEADPEAFDQLILKYTEDESAVNNKGHFKNVKEGDMVVGFEKAMIELQPGEISRLVPTSFGYHIIRVDAVHKSRSLSYAELEDQLLQVQLENHLKRLRLDYLNQLTNLEATITEEEVRKMLSRYYSEEDLARMEEAN
jgi:peptidyl-prolyl cis-trans isomerase C